MKQILILLSVLAVTGIYMIVNSSHSEAACGERKCYYTDAGEYVCEAGKALFTGGGCCKKKCKDPNCDDANCPSKKNKEDSASATGTSGPMSKVSYTSSSLSKKSGTKSALLVKPKKLFDSY